MRLGRREGSEGGGRREEENSKGVKR